MSQELLDLLVIDDEPEILRIVEMVIRDLPLQVRTASSISSAREALNSNKFRVVLSDQRLPDGNGIDFLQGLTSQGFDSVTILMTGLVDMAVATDAINRGKVFRLITKPLEINSLRLSIERAVERYEQDGDQKRVAHEVLKFNEHLRNESALKDRTLREAADRIREGEQTVVRQQRQIATLYTELQQAYMRTVMSLTAALDARDNYTRGHSDRVYHYCLLIADILGLDVQSRQDLELASILHDLGKIGVPDSILSKRGPLTADERAVMATHPALTESILEPLPFLSTVRRIVGEHHERYDGKGYPRGLKGTDISLEARILMVADAYDAMRSNRPYRQALPQEEAVKQLRESSGTQFCPMCVGALLVGLEERGEDAPENREKNLDKNWFGSMPLVTASVDEGVVLS